MKKPPETAARSDLRPGLAGAAAALSLVALVGAALAALAPTELPIGALARVLDATTPLMLALALIFALIAIALRARRVGGTLVLLTVMGSAALYLNYRSLTLPLAPDQMPGLSILFFNVEGGNIRSAEAIVAAAMETDADIVIFAEATALRSQLDRLRESYDFVSPCTETACELLIATDLNVLRSWQLQLNTAWPERYAVLEVETPEGAPQFVVANHLAKPWLSSFSETELALLTAQYDWFEAPVIAVGDYNMVPWTLPMRRLLTDTGFRAVRGQFATWPAEGTPIGLPIDQILVHDGPRVVSMAPFGGDLNSNHIGFIAEIALPAP